MNANTKINLRVWGTTYPPQPSAVRLRVTVPAAEPRWEDAEEAVDKTTSSFWRQLGRAHGRAHADDVEMFDLQSYLESNGPGAAAQTRVALEDAEQAQVPTDFFFDFVDAHIVGFWEARSEIQGGES